MLISFERTGFPMLVVEGTGLEIHLLPVTKWQFARFIAETDSLTPAAHEAMLGLNPLVQSEQVDQREAPDSFERSIPFRFETRETFFISGILPQEAQAFARWLGEGFALPTIKEWRGIYRAFRRTVVPFHNMAEEMIEPTAGQILSEILDNLARQSMLDLSLMQGGLVEWVQHGENWVGLGAPRHEFYPNLWDPLTNTVQPLQLDQRLFYFGFRLIRRGEWYLKEDNNTRFIY